MIVKAESSDENRSGITARPAKETRYSFGFRATGKNIEGLGGFDYTLEPVWQRGTTQAAGASPKSNDISAFAVHAEAGYTFKNVPWTPRIGYAYSFASGDDRNGGSAETFKQISPTQHAHNGYMDVTSWQNIEDHQIHFNVKPTKKLVLDVKMHFFKLDEVADNWYHIGGSAVNRAGGLASGGTFVNPAGTTERLDDTLGQEIDVTLKYKMFKNFGVVAGYGHFFADDYIEDTGGGVDRGIDWFYLQTTVKF
jgi:hypothetical protein